ncbi:transcription regulatory protein Snf12p [Trichomonascus vanleenenianus]|uniref:Rsc6p n=1 Tax=Trichomonascus vanleenenianus TaxID=2268995 RepID=UPI003ECB7595
MAAQQAGMARGNMPPNRMGGGRGGQPQTNGSVETQMAQNLSQHFHKKPTSRTLPERVGEIIPEAKLYKDLEQAERRLDATISRKRLDLQDSLARSIKKTDTLRVFISNTAIEQPWQSEAKLDSNAFDFDTGMLPSWNLRIEGRLVNDEPADSATRRKFSTFFTSIIVELETSDDVPAPPEGNIIEWHESQNMGPSVEFDALDIRRKGDRNVNARITMQLKEYPNRYRLSDGLSKLLAIDEDTKPGVVVALWQYIKFHKLQDNEEKRIIRCDQAMREVFGKDTITFPQIMELISHHLNPREPIVVDYTVRVDQESTMGETAFDITIEVDDPVRVELGKVLENWYSNQKDIFELDDQIAMTVEALNSSRLKRDFYAQLAENPAEFIPKWVASQARDLKVITSDKGFDEEEVRRSEFYNDELLGQSIHYFLNTPKV